MINYATILMLLIMSPLFVQSQGDVELFPVATGISKISFKVNVTNDKLSIVDVKLPEDGDFASIKSLYLKDADMVLVFEYKGKNEHFSREAVKILGMQKLESKKMFSAKNILEFDSLITTKKGVYGQRIWLDAFEKYLDFGGTYTLLVERTVFESINCALKKPTLRPIHYVPSISAGVVALGAIGFSSVFKKQRDDAYSDYVAAWKNGGSEGDGKLYFDKAKKQETKARLINSVGWSVLALGTLYISSSAWLVKQKQKKYEKYCQKGFTPSLSISNLINDGMMNSPTLGYVPGLKLGIQF